MVKEYVEADTNTHQPEEQKKERSSTFIAWFETALIILGLLANFFLLSHYNGGDGWDRFIVLWTLLTQGKIPNIKYSMVGPIFSIPFYYLGNIYQTPF